MPIVNGRLGRYCLKCNKRYIPTGKNQKICLDCSLKGSWQRARKEKVIKSNTLILAYNKLKEEYSKILHDETLKKYYILSKAFDLGHKIYGKSYSEVRLGLDFDIPQTTIHRILSLRRANKKTWKLIKSGKLSSFKATQILLTKNNRLQDQIVRAVINDKLSTSDISEYNKVTSLQEFKKIRLNEAVEKGFAKKSTAYISFAHYVYQLGKMLNLKKEDLPEDKLISIKYSLIDIKEKIDLFIQHLWETK
jgi:hypothetical protein